MNKLIALVCVCLALAVAMPAFAATAGPEAPAFAIDDMLLAGSVEIRNAIIASEKEVSAPLGRSTELLLASDIPNYDTMIEPECEKYFMSVAFVASAPLAPPGYYLLV